MFCNQCGHNNMEQFQYCSVCGLCLAENRPSQVQYITNEESLTYCAACGTGVNAFYCPACGRRATKRLEWVSNKNILKALRSNILSSNLFGKK